MCDDVRMDYQNEHNLENFVFLNDVDTDNQVTRVGRKQRKSTQSTAVYINADNVIGGDAVAEVHVFAMCILLQGIIPQETLQKCC